MDAASYVYLKTASGITVNLSILMDFGIEIHDFANWYYYCSTIGYFKKFYDEGLFYDLKCDARSAKLKFQKINY